MNVYRWLKNLGSGMRASTGLIYKGNSKDRISGLSSVLSSVQAGNTLSLAIGFLISDDNTVPYASHRNAKKINEMTSVK